jgi:hypothetical protein
LFLEEGDANMHFFHLQACHRNRINCISKLLHHGKVVVRKEDKEQALFQHFDAIFGNFEERSHDLDFERLSIPSLVLEGLDHRFLEEEVWAVISVLTPKKASGPDGFTGLFYQTMWPIIKCDVMCTFAAL